MFQAIGWLAAIGGWFGRREPIECHCYADLDRQLPEIFEGQLRRRGPEKLKSECPPCLCQCSLSDKELQIAAVLVLCVAFFAPGFYAGRWRIPRQRSGPLTASDSPRAGTELEEAAETEETSAEVALGKVVTSVMASAARIAPRGSSTPSTRLRSKTTLTDGGTTHA